jgi:hypothetical protein
MELNMAVTKTGRLGVRAVTLTTQQYRQLGETMLDTIKRRILRGINASGQRSKPLSKFYAKQKAKMRHTGHPIRDMFLTGLTLNSYRVVRAWGGTIRIEPTSAEGRKRAFFSQRREAMIGVTRSEERAVVAEARRMMGRNTTVAWEPTGR